MKGLASSKIVFYQSSVPFQVLFCDHIRIVVIILRIYHYVDALSDFLIEYWTKFVAIFFPVCLGYDCFTLQFAYGENDLFDCCCAAMMTI